jgi:predicted MFS family arabinose efflux permease
MDLIPRTNIAEAHFMTTAIDPIHSADRAQDRILTRPVIALMAISLGALSNIYLLFPVVPMMAIRVGAGPSLAGSCAGILMLCTVIVEPVTPWLTRRFGVRVVLVTGLLLLGMPAIAPILHPSIEMLLISSALRGLGIGIILVSETSLLASILPPDRRGEGMGLYAIAIGIPSLLFLPFGVEITHALGSTLVFGVAGGVALLPIAAVAALPRSASVHAVTRPSRLDTARMVRLALPFVATTIAIGVVSAFLPIAVRDSGVAVIGLLAQSCATPVARWAAGKLGRRTSTRRLMVTGLLVSALGMSALILIASPTMVVAGMAIFGAGFGLAQYASLTLLLDVGGPAGYDRASAIWNLAYDSGMGVGSGSFGLLVDSTGFSIGFAITAGALLAATVGELAAHRSDSRG